MPGEGTFPAINARIRAFRPETRRTTLSSCHDQRRQNVDVDAHLTATPGFNNPPSNIMSGGNIDTRLAVYAATQFFGPTLGLDTTGDIGQHDFFIGYWVVALGIGEKLGFNAALRAYSAKAGTVLDWLIAEHRKRIVGRINGAPMANLQDNSYTFYLWPASVIQAANGVVSTLPHTYTAVAAQNGNAPNWYTSATGGTAVSRDGEGCDQLLAGPSILKNQLGQTGTDLDAAASTVAGWRTQKKNEQLALGNNAGSSWFTYLNAVHNPAVS